MHNVPCELEAKRMIDAPKASISKCKLEVLSNRGDELCAGARSERQEYLEGLSIKFQDVVMRREVLCLN